MNACVFVSLSLCLFCFVFNLFRFSFISLKMANIGELSTGSWGPHPGSDSEKILNWFLYVFTSSRQRRKRKFNVVFVQVFKKSALDACAKFVVFHLLTGFVSFDVLIAVAVTVAFVVAPRIYRCA